MDMLATWVHVTISTVFVLVCMLLILVILLQKGRGGGLSGAFGGGGGGYSAFGAKTGDVFTWVTVVLTFLFILTAVLGNYWYVEEKPQALSSPGVKTTTNEPAEDAASSGDGTATEDAGSDRAGG